MRLKKIKLAGFKSFAEPVTLDFDADLVALVGPNGCGKSNIVDAFRWVMGEQSPRGMRADKMQDIIFAGSQTRKALNVAEVSLTFTSEDSEVAPSGEITITRRSYREGESDYLINKKSVRLKDIYALFLGKGVGKNAFCIFEQGKIDEMIRLSPFERRILFDETAQVLNFLQKKKETLQRLQEVDINYSRIKDIHSEVEKRRKSLKKQAESARHYQESKGRLNALEKNLLYAKYQKHFKSYAELSIEFEKINHILQQAREQGDSMQLQLQTLSETVLRQEKESNLLNTRFYHCESSLKIKMAEDKKEKERMLDFVARGKKGEKELAALQQRREDLLVQIEKNKRLLEGMQAEKEQIESQLKECESRWLEQKQVTHAIAEGQKHQQKKWREVLDSEQSVALQLQQAQYKATSLGEQVKKQSGRLTSCLEELRSLRICQDEKKEKLVLLSKEIDQERENLDRITREFDTHLKEEQNLQRELDASLHEQQRIEGEKITLLALKEDGEGFSKGAKTLLKEAKNKKSVLYNKVHPLCESFTPKQEVLHALRFYASTLLVKTASDAVAVLDYALEYDITDFSLYISQESDLESHFFKNFSFVQDRHALLEGSNERIFGDFFVDHKGVVFRGQTGVANAFARENRLRALIEKERLCCERNLELIEVKKEKLRVREAIEGRKKETELLWRKKEMHLVQEKFLAEQQALNVKKLEEEKKQIAAEIRRYENENQQVRVTIQECMSRHDELEKAKNALEQEVLKKEETFKACMQAEDRALQDKNKAHECYLKMLSKSQNFVQEIKILETKEHEVMLQEKKSLQEKAAIIEALQRGETLRARLKEEIENQAREFEQLEKDQKASLAQLGASKKQEQEWARTIQKEKSNTFTLQERHTRVSIACDKEREAYLAIEEECNRKFGPLEETPEGSIAIDKVEEEIVALRHEIENMKNLNLTSIEELEQEEERFEHLDTQLTDLEETKNGLSEIIRSLEQECRKRFKATFESIRKSFQKNFTLLFNGGSADLKFTSHDDVLEAGIEIVAQPPGKQMKSLALLSGGEKCLTSLALLFSFFEARPSPFCILDEVDAPLDEANVDRFTKMLQQYTGQTQFLIVTHNKKTMAIAETLFGISMEEKGVSKVISLQIQTAHQTTQGVTQ